MVLACLLASVANAQLGTVSGINLPAQVAITSTGHSQVNWSVIENVANPGLTGVSSSSGVFFAPDNSTLGTVTKTLQASRNVQVSGPTTFSLAESLTVPQSIILQAQKKGFGTFGYRRQFTDFPDNTTNAGAVTFTITGGGAAGVLAIRRVQMEYDDGRITAVVAPRSELHARAVLSYNGTGLLEYSWEVASPPGTQGQAIFVPLISRKQYLLAGDRVVLRSPRLPVDQQGVYLLRLRLHKPAALFELPLLRYAVNNSGQARVATHVQSLLVSRPATDAVIGLHTSFDWQPVTAASAYQLEIYDRPVRDQSVPAVRPQPPVTGMLVPATTNHLTVGNLSRAHLLSGHTYYWRVVAFSDKGQVMARSDFRRIKFP